MYTMVNIQCGIVCASAPGVQAHVTHQAVLLLVCRLQLIQLALVAKSRSCTKQRASLQLAINVNQQSSTEAFG